MLFFSVVATFIAAQAVGASVTFSEYAQHQQLHVNKGNTVANDWLLQFFASTSCDVYESAAYASSSDSVNQPCQRIPVLAQPGSTKALWSVSKSVWFAPINDATKVYLSKTPDCANAKPITDSCQAIEEEYLYYKVE